MSLRRPARACTLAVAMLAAAWSVSAWAQPEKPAPAASAQAQAAQAQAQTFDVEPSSLLRAALSVATALDLGRREEVYEGLSFVIKATIARDTFVESVKRNRLSLGPAQQRIWKSIERSQLETQPGQPAGSYITVVMLSTFVGNKQALEYISFRRDEDGTWRVAGYSAQP